MFIRIAARTAPRISVRQSAVAVSYIYYPRRLGRRDHSSSWNGI